MFDVCVIGGGPAGAALALRLARFGRKVALIEKDLFPRPHVGESLAGGIVPLLQTLDLRQSIEDAGFIRAPEAAVWWRERLEYKDTRGGYQVDRGLFDEIFLCAARNAGVTVRQPARALEMTFCRHWRLKLDSGEIFDARFLADAAGRARILPGRKRAAGARTLALYAYWSGVDAGDGSTLVEAGPSQWYWGAPIPGGAFNAAIFLDPADARPDRYLDLITKSRLLGSRLATTSCGVIHACDATSFIDEEPATACSIKVGDAAITIDPLSSQGVQTAIGTALHAAAVINTIIDRPEHAAVAMKFYRDRIAHSAHFHAQAAGELYRQQHETAPTEFWRKRIVMQSAPPASPINLRITPEQFIRTHGRISFVPVAIATDNYIVQVPGVELNGKSIACIDRVNLAELLEITSHPVVARNALHQWATFMPASSAMKMMQWALSHGILEIVD